MSRRQKIPLPPPKTPLDRRQTYGGVRGVTLCWNHGSWALRFHLDGRREVKTLATKNDDAARYWLTVTEGEVVQGQHRHQLKVYGARTATGLRFREAATQCFAEKRQTQAAVENTLFNWEWHLERYAYPLIGSLYVTAIIRDHVKQVLLRCLATQNRFGRPNSKGTAGVVFGAMNVVFSWAITEGMLKGRDGRDLANPCGGLRAMLRDRVGSDARRRVRPFRSEEQERIVAFFRGHANPAWRRWWLLVYLAFRAGLRIGELIALKIEDLDLERRVVTAQRTWTRCLYRNDCGKPVPGIQDFPKGKRIRVVHLAASLIPDLVRHIAERRHENRTHGWSSPWLFVNTQGRHTALSTFEQHYWLPALRELGLGEIALDEARRRFHNTRHNYASTTLYKTRDLAYVGRQLGHTMQRTTELYAHVMEELEQHLVDLTDEPARAVTAASRWGRRATPLRVVPSSPTVTTTSP